jgi:hypothetical protein
MKVYVVIADYTYDHEILYVFKRLRDAKFAQETEQENFRASGAYTDVIIETWDVE